LAQSKSAVFAANDIQTFLCNMLGVQEPHPLRHAQFNIALAIRVRPRVDLRRLNRAFQTVQQRHDVLRAGFEPKGDGWIVRLHDKPRASVEVHDFGPVAPDEQAAHLVPFLDAPPDLGRDPLVRIDLLRFGDEGDVLLFQFSHTIIDGYGTLVILDELLHLQIGMPLAGNPPSYADYVSYVQRQKTADRETRAKYWKELLLPCLPAPEFGRKSKGLPLDPPKSDPRRVAVHVVSLDPDLTDRLLASVRHQGCTLFSRMTAAFQMTMQQGYGTQDCYFDWQLGRHDSFLSRYPGMHMNLVPGRSSAANGSDMATQTAAMNRQIQESIVHTPHGDVSPGGQLLTQIREAGGNPGQIHLHMARSEARQSQSLLAPLMDSPDYVQNVGPFTVQGVPVKRPVTTNCDLKIYEKRGSAGVSLEFVYDVDALTADETTGFATEFIGHFTDGMR